MSDDDGKESPEELASSTTVEEKREEEDGGKKPLEIVANDAADNGTSEREVVECTLIAEGEEAASFEESVPLI